MKSFLQFLQESHDLKNHVVPAVKLMNGKIVTGQRGDMHFDVLYKNQKGLTRSLIPPAASHAHHYGFFHKKNKTFHTHHEVGVGTAADLDDKAWKRRERRGDFIGIEDKIENFYSGLPK
jgi:hypothetical protein